MIEEKIIKKKFDAMCEATAAWKNEIAKTLQAFGHPFYIVDDMKEERNPFFRVIEDDRAMFYRADMVRSDDGLNIYVHLVVSDYKETDEWVHIDALGEEAGEFLLENILWLNKNDLVRIGSGNHDGEVVDIMSHTNVSLYAVHADGMVERVMELDDYDGVSIEFYVHRYEWSKAMQELDEYENNKEND